MYKLFVGTLPDCRRVVEGAYLVACGRGGQLEHLVPFAGCLQQVCYKGFFDLGMNAQGSFPPVLTFSTYIKHPGMTDGPVIAPAVSSNACCKGVRRIGPKRPSTQETYPI